VISLRLLESRISHPFSWYARLYPVDSDLLLFIDSVISVSQSSHPLCVEPVICAIIVLIVLFFFGRVLLRRVWGCYMVSDPHATSWVFNLDFDI